MATDYSKLPIVIVTENRTTGFADLLPAYDSNENLVLVESETVLEYLSQTEVTAIILDLELPIEKGLELLRRITANHPGIPIIVVTGSGNIDSAVACMKLGAYDYLTEPISLDRIVESIRGALDLRCLNEVASLLRTTPCKQSTQLSSSVVDDFGPQPFKLPEDLPERLRLAVNFMDLNLSKPLSLDAIAREACLSKFHFCREFKKHLGISPIRFMMNRRICQATLLLQNKALSISRVAIQSGFSDQSEFTKWFKKTTGFTPSWYRKSFATRDSSPSLAATSH